MMTEPWSGADIERLRSLYSTMSLDDLAWVFAPRSADAIRHQAWRLGLRRRRKWEEIAKAHSPIFAFPTEVPA